MRSTPFRLGPWLVDPGLCEISSGEQARHVEPRTMEVLCHLAAHAGTTVSRDQLLGDQARDSRYIQTIPKVGYRLLVIPEPVDAARAAVPAKPAHERPMLVVLPLDNLSGDPAFEYVSDGFTDAIITELGALDPERLGVIAQLIRAQDQTHLWGRNYESPTRDVLQLQSAVAAAVAHEIGAQLTMPGRRRAPTRVDPVAYEQYLKGRYFWNMRTDEGLRIALGHFEQALALDPWFAPAQSGLASCWTFRSVYGPHTPRDTLPIARSAALRAIELDEESSEAHAALGLALTWLDHDWEGGERELKRAIELDPNNAMARQWYGSWLGMLRRSAHALDEIQAALQLDPLSPSAHFAHAFVLSMMGHDYYLARLHACLGNVEEAVDCLHRAYDERSILLMAMGNDSFLGPVHAHPRYRTLVATMKIPMTH